MQYQDSHGHAYCGHFWGKRVVKTSTGAYPDPAVIGADGVTEYYCPKCKNNTHAKGAMFLVGVWSDYFDIDVVKKLERPPLVLMYASCCLTAITDKFPKAWLGLEVVFRMGSSCACTCKGFCRRFLQEMV